MLQSAVNAYCQLHVTNTANADAYAAAMASKSLMRSVECTQVALLWLIVRQSTSILQSCNR
jgi:hypothetical protein